MNIVNRILDSDSGIFIAASLDTAHQIAADLGAGGAYLIHAAGSQDVHSESRHAWAEKWRKPAQAEPAVQDANKTCDNDPGLGVVCQSCGPELRQNDLGVRFAPSFAMERDAKLTFFKVKRA